MTGGIRDEGADVRRRGRAALAAGVGLFLAGRVAAGFGVAAAETWSYQWSWYPLLLAVDGLLAASAGRFALLSRPRFAASLFLWSVPTWLFFELLNLRIGNWFYVGVPGSRTVRWAGYVLAFATVLPAIWLPHRALDVAGLARGLRGPRFRVDRGVRWGLALLGIAFLVLPLWRPRLFFPLVWGGAALVLAPWNHRRDAGTSLLGRMAAGRYGRTVRLLCAGLVAGLAWESLNWLSEARWIYTVPGLEELKLFEMPLLGFLGFPAFAVECDVVYRSLVNARVALPPDGGSLRRWRTAALGALALAFSAGVAWGGDRWTVASHEASLENLPGVGPEAAERLRAAGVRGPEQLAGADSADLAVRLEVTPGEAGDWIAAAELAGLRGLGTRGAGALRAGGIRRVCDLAGVGQERLGELLGPSGLLGPPSAGPRRVRVWLRAARTRCPDAGPQNARDSP